GDIMAGRRKIAGVAYEGGWWPLFDTNEEALEALVSAIERAGENPGDRVVIALDIAASEFSEDGGYRLSLEDRYMDSGALTDMFEGWLDAYPIVSIEDPMAENDVEGMAEFTQRFGDRVQVVGDDFLVTNADLVEDAAAAGACNALLVKVNQSGTVSESVAAFHAAREHGWGTIVSARSGETEDVSISHLSVGLGGGQLKVGSFTRSVRMAKWNECLRIQEELGKTAFVGGTVLANTWWGQQR
ncbi:MAG: phosphopyruvate hydratase, partial [Boseongicola sp. SB0667_bin_21]|nr:phosphopyruvate hydratase [Boseongicola sp. SB0667_bin_21]